MSDAKTDKAKDLKARLGALIAERDAFLKSCTDTERELVEAFLDASLPDDTLSAKVDTLLTNTQSIDALVTRTRSIDALVNRTASIEAQVERNRKILIGGVGAVAIAGLLIWLVATQGQSAADAQGESRSTLASAGFMIAGAIAGIICAIGVASALTDFEKLWRNIQLVFESGTFYFFAGLTMIASALLMTDKLQHPSLTFILAMLGVAVLLFGTGSQATGALATYGAPLPEPPKSLKDGETPPLPQPPPQNGDTSWGPFKANAAVAGGAAVLTALFGFGVIYYHRDIRDVFADFDEYRRIQIYPCASFNSECTEQDIANMAQRGAFKLNDRQIEASSFSSPRLFVRKTGTMAEILAFESEVGPDSYLKVRLEYDGTDSENSDLEPTETISVPWPERRVGEADGGPVGEEKKCESWIDDERKICRLMRISPPARSRSDQLFRTTYVVNLMKRDLLAGGTKPIDVVVTKTPDTGGAEISGTNEEISIK